MSKLEEAKNILNELKVPPKQQSDLCGYVILAMADIKKNDEWANATNKWIRIHDVIAFIREFYEVSYAENSRETFRKQAMHHFRNAAFIEDNGKATNSPNYRYRLTDEMLLLVKT
ncbi:TPA: restriction endonuclease, partial [Streptococcus equi subsp. equi]|nr:restriction endonuclease [Streptococcus equi subsp. equi]